MTITITRGDAPGTFARITDGTNTLTGSWTSVGAAIHDFAVMVANLHISMPEDIKPRIRIVDARQ